MVDIAITKVIGTISRNENRETTNYNRGKNSSNGTIRLFYGIQFRIRMSRKLIGREKRRPKNTTHLFAVPG